VHVQLRNVAGVLEGYAFQDCDPIASDGLAVPVGWRGKTRLPESDEPLQIEFRLRKASLYTFSF